MDIHLFLKRNGQLWNRYHLIKKTLLYAIQNFLMKEMGEDFWNSENLMQFNVNGRKILVRRTTRKFSELFIEVIFFQDKTGCGFQTYNFQ